MKNMIIVGLLTVLLAVGTSQVLASSTINPQNSGTMTSNMNGHMGQGCGMNDGMEHMMNGGSMNCVDRRPRVIMRPPKW
ncbi:MAG: hypothetical protein ACLPY5_06045 [Candidatus Bathyarchaeia archaeon]